MLDSQSLIRSGFAAWHELTSLQQAVVVAGVFIGGWLILPKIIGVWLRLMRYAALLVLGLALIGMFFPKTFCMLPWISQQNSFCN